MHGGFGFGDRNPGGVALFDFLKAFDLFITNSWFMKRENHLITFRSASAKTQIDFLLLRRADRSVCEDCKVIPSEVLTTQHKLLVMDLVIKGGKVRKKRKGMSKIRWWTLNKDNMSVLDEKVSDCGGWETEGDANSIWEKTSSCIRKVASEVLGVSKSSHQSRRNTWWWDEEVRSKVEAKKMAYRKLKESKDEVERGINKVSYKRAEKESKLAVARAKSEPLEGLYGGLEAKDGVRNLFKLAKVRERKSSRP